MQSPTVTTDGDAVARPDADVTGRVPAPTIPPPAAAREPKERDGPHLPYLGGIDGLRAIAVGSVLLYHAEFSWMIGGFLGVEVFFVISGYLITALLLAEHTRTGHIGMGRFYLRRARRLLPALFVTLLAVLVLALIFQPDQVAGLRGDVLAAFGYVTNWYFIVADKSYFEAIGSPSMVKHLWSLAIEEQFYLVWPLIFGGMLKLLGRRRVIVGVVALIAASTLWMAHLYGDGDPADVNSVYMGTDTRAAGLLIGALLALVWSPWRLNKKRTGRGAPLLLDAAGVGALALLVYALYGVSEFSPDLYRGGFAKVSLLTAVVIAVAAHPAARLGRVLGCAPLRFIGLRSYGIYLYHFPIFVLVAPDPIDPAPNQWVWFTVRLALTLAAAELSFRFIEMPVRRGVLGRWWKTWRSSAATSPHGMFQLRWVGAVAVLVLAFGVLTVGVSRAQPPPDPDLIAIGTGAGDPDLSLPPELTAITADPGTDPSAVSSTLPTSAPPASDSSTTTVDPTATTVPVPETTLPPTTSPLATTPTTNPHGSVRTVGDSVMLGASVALRNTIGGGTVVDAAVNRQVNVAVQILQQWSAAGELPDVLVIHMGNNGTFTSQQFDQIMSIAGDQRRVLAVTNKVPRRWQDTNNTVIGDGCRSHANCVLVDWYTASFDHPEYFYTDGIHLRPEGAQAYANLIASYL